MSRDKQIIEMADDIRRIRESYFGQADYLFAKKLYEDGYRKASDVAEEIFAEMETVLYSVVTPTVRGDGTIGTKRVDGLHIRIEDYNELKKKYTESEDTE